jgi:hypothetical protein
MKKAPSRSACIGMVASISFIGIAGLTIAAILAVLACRSCTAFLDDLTRSVHDTPTGEDFFESSGGWGYRRIPLIDPYQAVSINEGMWMIELRTDSRFQSTVANIEKLNVVNNSHIVSYSTNALVRGERVDELWSIIVPDEGIEMGFTEEHEFLAYLESSGIDELHLIDVDDLYKELVDEGYLEWFPEGYKE